MFFKKNYGNRVSILRKKHVFLRKKLVFYKKNAEITVISFLYMVSKKVTFSNFAIENPRFEMHILSFKIVIFDRISDFDKFF